MLYLRQLSRKAHFYTNYSRQLSVLSSNVNQSRGTVWQRRRSDPFTGLTKIVGTIGPVSESKEKLQEIIAAGMRIMRINFSHATYEEASTRIDNMRASKGLHSEAQLHSENLRATLLDTQGPEIRSGSLKDGKIRLERGQIIRLSTSEADRESGDESCIFIDYKKLPQTMSVGDTIFLDDGLFTLTVVPNPEKEGDSTDDVYCHVENTGVLGSRKGVNLPGKILDLPALTEKDRKDLQFGVDKDMDFVAASFVRRKGDVMAIKEYLFRLSTERWGPSHPPPLVISKIENGEGLDNFDEILEASDGVEVPVETVFRSQKEMIAKCQKAGKPVIVATQMLESMSKNPRPTRAEVSDVANAVLDGADCVMLSGETANGEYPTESVECMRRSIIEADLHIRSMNESNVAPEKNYGPDGEDSPEAVTARAAVSAAENFSAPLIICMTQSGFQARLLAKFRPNCPIMAYGRDTKVARQLQPYRAIFPVVDQSVEGADSGSADDYSQRLQDAVSSAKQLGWVVPGDHVVLVSAEGQSGALSKTSTLRISQVK